MKKKYELIINRSYRKIIHFGFFQNKNKAKDYAERTVKFGMSIRSSVKDMKTNKIIYDIQPKVA